MPEGTAGTATGSPTGTGTATGGTATGGTATGGTATGGTATGGTATGGTATGGTATGGTATGTGTGTGTGGGPVLTLPNWTGTCAPPDLWSGEIDPALYSLTPYSPSYDGLLLDLTNYVGLTGSASWGSGRLLIDATVTATSEYGWNNWDRVYVQDGLWAWAGVIQGSGSVVPGDRITVVVQGYESGGIIEIPTTVLNSVDNLVSVYDLQAETLDYQIHGARMTHLYGEIVQASGHDCDAGYLCFRVEHNGVSDLIRVQQGNTHGLDVDYQGGDCVEVIAPVKLFDGATGEIHFLDVREDTWMRLYPTP